jgi:SAM-dependent methyltransferase
VQLYTVTAEESAQHFVLREADAARHAKLTAHIKALWHGTNCGVWRCSTCQFGFSHPYVAGDATFYNLAYERSNYPHDKWEYGRTIKALQESAFHGGRVLEVGAGFGHFLDKIADKYVPRSGVTALEYDAASIAILRGKEYCTVQGDIRGADIVPGFDAIFLFQVVEHMDHLDLLFSRLHELVARGGRVYIAVPNPRHTDFQESSGSLLDMPPNHIGRWSRSAFEIMTAAAGMRISALEVEPLSLSAFIKQDIAYSYLRKAQRSGTIWNWSLAKRAKGRGKLLTAAFAMAAAPLRVPVWLRAIRARSGGGSMWVELTRD